MASAATHNKRSWRSPPRGGLVRRSRYVWRWILTGLAITLITVAVYWAWPRRLPQTMLLVLTDNREERNILPPVPFVAADSAALKSWADAAKVPALAKQLSEIEDAAWLARRLSPTTADNSLTFSRAGTSGTSTIKNGDTLVIYIKGHGLALDTSTSNNSTSNIGRSNSSTSDTSRNDKSDVRPLLIKSLSETDLSTAWYRDKEHVLDLRELLQQLAGLSPVRIVLILDAVYLNYDPRLGILVNAFPSAVEQALEQLPARSNLCVVLGQGDGQLAVGSAEKGRSALVDSLVTSLERNQNTPVGISVAQTVERVQTRLSKLNQPARGSFRQSVYLPATLAGGIADSLTLPTAPPSSEKQSAEQKTATGELARAVVATAPVQTATAPAQQAVTAATTAAKAVSDSAGAASQAANSKDATANPSTATTTTASSPASPPAATPPAAISPASPATQSNDLELAWQSRDRLRDSYRIGWTPVHVAPALWRRIEGLLAGFDEQRFTGVQGDRDHQTLRDLRDDLTALEAVFEGQNADFKTDDCRDVAASFAAFKTSPAFRSFQARQPSGLDTANEALKVFAETAYRARDYVYLHGQMAAVLDGGPLVNDADLDALLDKLKLLASRLDPADLPDGRLTDQRFRELAKTQRDLEAAREQVQRDLESYCQSVADAPISPGKSLRVRLLLHSPALTGKQRADLRNSADSKLSTADSTGSPPELALGSRLAANARLMKKLLELLAPPAQTSGQKASPPGIARWIQALDAPPTSADLLAWAPLGREARQMAENGPAVVQAELGSATTRGSEPLPLLTWRAWRAALLVDGRDVRRQPERTLPASSIVQLLRPELLPDKVQLTGPEQPIQLHSPEEEPATAVVTIRVQSENPPPYKVSLDFNWNSNDLNLTRADNGAAIRRDRNDLLLESDTLELPLRIKAQRMTVEAPNSALRATAHFGAAQVAANIRLVLPRPDQVELTLAPDDNLAAAKRRTWSPSLPDGGRLNLFANREQAVGLYLRNLSSEDKRLVARLYRVPPAATSLGGRLFDQKAGLALLSAAARLHTQLQQPAADLSLLRGQLIAQTNDKEPVLLPAGSAAVKLPLAAVASTAASPTPGAGAPNPATDKNSDVTGGLLLVVTSADGKGRPYFKWIELQMLRPDDLLSIKEATYREGKLSFRVQLKDSRLVDEMGLGKQPLKLTWEAQALPQEVREPTREVQLTATDNQGAAFTAIVPPSVRWPLYLQLHVDSDPRGLVARLERQNEGVVVNNLKENHPPELHIWRAGAAASRVGAPPELVQRLIRPPQPWLAFPSATAIADGLAEQPRNQPMLVRIDPAMPTARLDISLGADVAANFLADGARLRVSAEGQPIEFATERQINFRLTGIDAGALQLQCDASDFTRIELGQIDVSRQDKLVEVSTEMSGVPTNSATSEYGASSVRVILDRTPPTVDHVSATKVNLPASPTSPPPMETKIYLSCRATDGNGSGIEKVQFVHGFDQNTNGRLDEAEKGPPEPGIRQADGSYFAYIAIPAPPPRDRLFVEAIATDKVQHTSEAARTSLPLPTPQPQGSQRTTFGKEKVEDASGKAPKMAVPGKK